MLSATASAVSCLEAACTKEAVHDSDQTSAAHDVRQLHKNACAMGRRLSESICCYVLVLHYAASVHPQLLHHDPP